MIFISKHKQAKKRYTDFLAKNSGLSADYMIRARVLIDVMNRHQAGALLHV